jgi:hypothetical protein
MPRSCEVPSCSGAAQAKGLCRTHCGRLRRNGDLTASGQHGGHNRGQGRQQKAPDPGPVRLLHDELLKARARRASFACLVGSHDPPPRLARRWERYEWSDVLCAHKKIWKAAYEGRELPSLYPFATLRPSWDDVEAWAVMAPRDGTAVITTGARHDGPSQLDPVEVPWCA